MSTISNTDDVIDSRDVIERVEELEAERQELQDEFDASVECVKYHHCGELDEDGEYGEHSEYRRCRDELQAWDADNAEELKALKALADQAEGYAGDWCHGETLIRESYWEDYVQELLEDVGDIPRDMPHYLVIDWEATARNIAVDYTEVDFDGVTYYIRSC